MRRMVFLLFCLVLVLGGCEKSGDVVFTCTQQAVCDKPIAAGTYSFLDHAENTGIVVPGLRQNFIPQGITHWEERNWLLISGYFLPVTEGMNSAILAVALPSGRLVGEYSLKNKDGRAYNGHFSGLAVAEKDLYVTGPNCLYRIPLREFSKAGQKGALTVAQEIPVQVAAAGCAYSDGILWVSEYYQKDNFPLTGEHVTLCGDGTTHYAWMMGYRIVDREKLEPCFVISIPDRVQGVAFLPDGKLVLSQSYGRKNPSKIFLFQDPRNGSADGWVSVAGRNLPLWYLDSTSGLQTMDAPPMAEGCCEDGDAVYFIFESAAYFYRGMAKENTSLHPTDRIWKLNIKK